VTICDIPCRFAWGTRLWIMVVLVCPDARVKEPKQEHGIRRQGALACMLQA